MESAFLRAMYYLCVRKVRLLGTGRKGILYHCGTLCQAAALKDYPKVLKLFCYSDLSYSCDPLWSEYGIAKESAETEIKRVNRNRIHHYEYLYGEKWGEPHRYDLMLNTGLLKLENGLSAGERSLSRLRRPDKPFQNLCDNGFRILHALPVVFDKNNEGITVTIRGTVQIRHR